MTSLLLRHGRVIDPARKVDRVADVLIRDGRIVEMGAIAADAADEVLDCTRRIVAPGLIDLHVATRDPGFEEDETTQTATAAALRGGFTAFAALPDTLPVVDNRAAAEYVVLQAARARHCRVFPLGAVTRNHQGEELADLGQLSDGGAVGFTDAKRPIARAEILRRALEYARMFDRPVFTHPQDPTLTAGGVMHEGYYSTLLGLRGMPAAAEEVMVSRDIALTELTGGRVHLMCLSTRNAVDRVRRAKQSGLPVTADVAIHHLLLNDDRLQTFQSSFKVDPPLRDIGHQQALIEGLQDGTIDAICSDHQPWAVEKKDRELDLAPAGIVGLETLLPLCVKALIEPGWLTWPQLLSKLTSGPAAVLRLPDAGTLRVGGAADITVIDPEHSWTVDPQQFASRSRNTPFAGWNVSGRAEVVIVDGEVRYRLDDPQGYGNANGRANSPGAR
jgi:dihydroorotase